MKTMTETFFVEGARINLSLPLEMIGIEGWRCTYLRCTVHASVQTAVASDWRAVR